MTKTDDLRNKDLSQSRDFQLLPTRNCKESIEIPMSSTIELSEDEYEQRMQEAVEKALKKQTTAAEVDELRRIEAANAQVESVERPTSLFHSFVPTEELSELLENYPVHALLGSAFASPGSTQQELEAALNLRVVQHPLRRQ